MSEEILIGIATIFVLGMGAQWLAWRFRLPSILLLMIFGFIVGPVTGFLHPDALFGELLFPLVSVSVAIILFEGGLSLSIAELRQVGKAVRNLIGLGVLITWLLSAALAYFLFDLELALAALFGAILVVTGPTVIVPLMRHIRPVGPVSSVAKWEGIINDPIGAVLAVLVFEAILAGGLQQATSLALIGLFKTVLIAVVIGGIGAGLMVFLLKRHWIPGFLQNGITLMLVIGAFTLSDLFQAESGLLTVTLMGILLANQEFTPVKHIVEFKENLRVILISGLFILLTARLELAELTHLSLNSLIFLAALILLVRPLSVLLSTINSELSRKEKLFLSWMAPRGIVAAAVVSIFAIDLVETGRFPEAGQMVPEMFLIIAGTVAVYGLTAGPVGRWLGVAQPNPQGVLIVGAHSWAQKIARFLQKEEYQVLLVDSNRENINSARQQDELPTFYASILSEYVLDEIELGSLGRLLALTPNDEVNSLAALHFTDVFDRTEVYQLPPKEAKSNRKETVSSPLRGRLLFDTQATHAHLSERFEAGAVLKKTKLTEEFDYATFNKRYGDQTNALPLFVIDEIGNLIIQTTEQSQEPAPGQTLISLVDNDEDMDGPPWPAHNLQQASSEDKQQPAAVQ